MPILPATPDNIQRAAQLLRDGELVAFPTETVYGLGANALDADGVQKIFAAKGRPIFNPLIVHVRDEEHARSLVTHWPQRAQILARHFWPGALTLILPKRETVPDIVTAGLKNVALRAPSHPVARALLQLSQLPLAAPSANKYTQTSPTRAVHVASSLNDDKIKIDITILDGGACEVGIESTVLDLSRNTPVLLRYGTITREEIEAALQQKIDIEYSNDDGDAPRRAPGQVRKHYAPRARLLIIQSSQIDDETLSHVRNARKVGAIVISILDAQVINRVQHFVRIPNHVLQYARHFYDALHELDALDCDLILVEEVPPTSAWNGVRDRLHRAASI